MDARTGTGMCGPYNPVCPSGWGKCPNCPAKNTCRPLTEDACPTGWTLHRDDAAYPGGLVCKPECQKPQGKPGRESDGYCYELNTDCAEGYDTTYDGPAGSRTYYCRPKEYKIKDKYYKT